MSTPLKHQCPECGRDCYCALEANEDCIHDCGGEFDEDEEDDGGWGTGANACDSLWDTDTTGETAE
jgi:hypothetical protein